MGIFGRGRAPRSLMPMPLDLQESWQPSGGVHVGLPVQGSNEPLNAYGVSFTLGIAPGASITIWVYAASCPPGTPGDFEIAYACEYRVDVIGGEPWVTWQYDTDAEWYFDFADCDAACRDYAQTLATTPRIGPSTDDLQFFDWDGSLPR